METTHPIWYHPRLRPKELKEILSDSSHPDFSKTAASLLSATSDIHEIKKWISLKVLAKHYHSKIKRRLARGFRRASADLLVAAIIGEIPPRKALLKQNRTRSRDSEMVALGRRLREFRESLGLTATDIARRKGVSRQWVSSIENGKSAITVVTLMGYVDATGGTISIEFHKQ